MFLQLEREGLVNLDPSLVDVPTKTVVSMLKARLTKVGKRPSYDTPFAGVALIAVGVGVYYRVFPTTA